MKFIKLLLVIMAAALITLSLGGNGLAFHEEGVAYCAGCHTMHNSQDGKPIVPGAAGDYLLRQVDASSTCLRCHADYGQLTGMGGENSPPGGSGYGGGGDFYWLKRDFVWEAHGHEATSTGDSHGHNIIARDFGLVKTDAQLGNKAPGGTFNHELSCASCHDPHGLIARMEPLSQQPQSLHRPAAGPPPATRFRTQTIQPTIMACLHGVLAVTQPLLKVMLPACIQQMSK